MKRTGVKTIRDIVGKLQDLDLAREQSVEDKVVQWAAVFLQHAGLAALRRLLDWSAGAAEMPDRRRLDALGNPLRSRQINAEHGRRPALLSGHPRRVRP